MRPPARNAHGVNPDCMILVVPASDGQIRELLSRLRTRIDSATTPEPDPGLVNVGVDALGLLTVPEVAKALRISTGTVWRRIRIGEIESVTIGSARRITPALRDYIDGLSAI